MPLLSIEAATCAAAFIDSWVSRFGVPNQMLGLACASCWGSNTSTLSLTTLSQMGLSSARTGSLKKCLGRAWTPTSGFSTFHGPKEDSSLSSAELLYGSALVLPGQFLSTQELPIPDLLQQLLETPRLSTRLLPKPAPTSPPQHCSLRRTCMCAELLPQRNWPLSMRALTKYWRAAPKSSGYRLMVARRLSQWTISNIISGPPTSPQLSLYAMAGPLHYVTDAAMP
jgi:hypothetical protein